MTQTLHTKPLPIPSEQAAPFWAALRAKEVRLQRCQNCGHYNHPPKYICPRCHFDELGWEAVAHTGTVYSYTIVHRPPVPAFKDDVPYAVGLADIDDTGVRLLANFLGPANAVRVGKRVQIVFDDVTPDFSLFRFKLLEGRGDGSQ